MLEVVTWLEGWLKRETDEEGSRVSSPTRVSSIECSSSSIPSSSPNMLSSSVSSLEAFWRVLWGMPRALRTSFRYPTTAPLTTTFPFTLVESGITVWIPKENIF